MLPPHPHHMLVLDLDDTLLRSDGTISERTMNALRRWREAGHATVIATGRPTRNVANVIPEELHTVPWITYNGAYIYLDGECIYENLIPPAAVQTILNLVNKCLPDCVVGLECGNSLYLNRDIQRTPPYSVVDLMTVADQPAAKILFYQQEREALQSLVSELPVETRALFSDRYNFVQILAATADKMHALRFLLDRLGLEMAQAIAIGDDINDVEMIRESGLGVAVANAVPAVKAVADHMTLSNDEDGVAIVIEEILRKRGE